MRFSEAHDGWQERRLTQEEAAWLLGTSGSVSAGRSAKEACSMDYSALGIPPPASAGLHRAARSQGSHPRGIVRAKQVASCREAGSARP